MCKVLVEAQMPFEGVFAQEDVYAFYGLRFRSYICIRGFLPLPNVHPEPERRFAVLTKDVQRLSIPAPSRLLGIAHRHPPGMYPPSQGDIEGLPPGLLGMVWCDGISTLYTRKGAMESKALQGSKYRLNQKVS